MENHPRPYLLLPVKPAPGKKRTVILTGAGGRLGRVIVRRLADTGAAIVAIDVETVGDLPDGAVSLAADLADERAVALAFAEAEAVAGLPAALIHTVGMWTGKPLVEVELDEWRAAMDTNLTTTFLCFREAARRMGDRGGRLVAIGSGQGADRGVAGQAAYSAAKAGVIRLVESVAAEFAGRITAAAVAPSLILFGDEDPGTKGVPVDAVADLCVYLAGEGGVVHNGQVLRAYGTLL